MPIMCLKFVGAFISHTCISLSLCSLSLRTLLRDSREVYGLDLPLALRSLLDGVLHPVPDRRFSLEEALGWMDLHPEIF